MAPHQHLGRPHTLIVSHDVVDQRMAGPGIRYWELARVLAQHVPVTLAVPGQTALEGDGFELHAYHRDDPETLQGVFERSDVVMPCGSTLVDFPYLAEGEQPLVIDGYDPFVVETLALSVREPMQVQEARHAALLALRRRQCLLGDFFLCASERQRDWWLGLLEAQGRVNPHTYAVDPTMRPLVEVVPFGLPPRPPRHTRWVLKGAVPGIGRHDKVILWGGGIWEWLDPLTLIRAMPKVVEKCPEARLVFPGTRHPNTEAVPDMPMRQCAWQLAQELGMLDRTVFFGEWVDYADWPNFLLEADVGVSLHFDTLEARLAFRSRVMDYIWAELPMVVTCGDATSEVVAQNSLGCVVGFEAVNEVAAAILALLQDGRETWRTRFADVRQAFSWERVAEPLVSFCTQPRRAADRRQERDGFLAADHSVEDLQLRLERQAQELAVLRSRVAGYERGRFIRLMKWWHDVRRGKGDV